MKRGNFKYYENEAGITFLVTTVALPSVLCVCVCVARLNILSDLEKRTTMKIKVANPSRKHYRDVTLNNMTRTTMFIYFVLRDGSVIRGNFKYCVTTAAVSIMGPNISHPKLNSTGQM